MELRVTGPAPLRGCHVRVPGDFSAAAFFLAAAAATPGARVQALGVGLNETRIRLLEVLKDMGALVEVGNVALLGEEPVGDVTVRGPARLTPGYIPATSVVGLLDEIPAWAVAASAAAGVSRLRGADELRVKESDRLGALAEGLDALGVAGGGDRRRPRHPRGPGERRRGQRPRRPPDRDGPGAARHARERARSAWTTRPASPRRIPASRRTCAPSAGWRRRAGGEGAAA